MCLVACSRSSNSSQLLCFPASFLHSWGRNASANRCYFVIFHRLPITLLWALLRKKTLNGKKMFCKLSIRDIAALLKESTSNVVPSSLISIKRTPFSLLVKIYSQHREFLGYVEHFLCILSIILLARLNTSIYCKGRNNCPEYLGKFDNAIFAEWGSLPKKHLNPC